jgi:hypothetical protein
MILNGGMSIWILAILILILAALAGWRQGAIRAAIAFVGIIIAALLAVPLGHLVHPLLPHLGASSPVSAWALAPVCGFILGSIPFMVAAQMVHNRAEHFYKYRAGDLQLALWTRLNTRLGICIGVLNGVAYFVLISFFVFNMAYWTTQATKDPSDRADQPLTSRLVSYMGEGLQSSGFSQTASAVGTLPPVFYKLADFLGLLMQNPQVGPRLAEYPGLISLWHRDDMQPLVTDPNVTNALASGTSLGEILKVPSVQGLIANKDLTKVVLGAVTNNLDDITRYLNTGQSAKYGNEPILGNWTFNAGVTLAWLRQDQPKMAANDMAAVRGLWAEAYAPMTLLLTGDNQIYVKGFPKFVKPEPNQPAFQSQDWQGDWSKDGTNYTFHISFNGEDKYLNANTDGLRMNIKDGRTLLIFDHAN